MKPYWIFKAMKFIFFATLFVIAGGYVIMSLWNWLIPAIFTGHISFGQAIGILILMRILVGGFGHRGGWGHRGWHGHYNWKQRMESRMANMTPEEREKFKQNLKERWGKGCGPWSKEEMENPVNTQ
jgi:hypothetical protein